MRLVTIKHTFHICVAMRPICCCRACYSVGEIFALMPTGCCFVCGTKTRRLNRKWQCCNLALITFTFKSVSLLWSSAAWSVPVWSYGAFLLALTAAPGDGALICFSVTNTTALKPRRAALNWTTFRGVLMWTAPQPTHYNPHSPPQTSLWCNTQLMWAQEARESEVLNFKLWWASKLVQFYGSCNAWKYLMCSLWL